MNSIFTSPVFTMEKLNQVYIVLTSKNCNQRCKHCYIDFPMSKQVKDFIDVNRVKDMLIDTRHESLSCISLTGAEPMLHPNFNAILRMCLKRTNVCICTNASLINEKKARFFRKVEEEGRNSLFFRISLWHFDESKNDSVRYRGAFRQSLFAIKNLEKYGFTVILEVVNYYNEEEEFLKQGFLELFSRYEISPELFMQSYFNEDIVDYNNKTKDCMFSRTLSSNGVYSCPYLANDYRGRMGSDFKDYSKSIKAECSYCAACSACVIADVNADT